MSRPTERVDVLLAELRRRGQRITTGRRAIAEVLVGADNLSAEEIVAAVQDDHPDLAASTVYRTLETLEEAGLIVQGQKAQYRPCTINAAPLKEISTWADQYRHIWEASFDRMDDYIHQLNNKENNNE